MYLLYKAEKENFKTNVCGVGEGGEAVTSSLKQEVMGVMGNMVFI